MNRVSIFPVLALIVLGTVAHADRGKELFDNNCVACHGADGQGDGPNAAQISGGVPDLTKIAARNGGSFPTIDVMSFIDGYTRDTGASDPMPEFGALMVDAPLVLYDGGDGIPTPTPEPLVQVTEYLKSIQR